ncbi:putative LRR containing protein [Trachipleistophora hominis]|uniref:Putative LRR containing protein n=1 Tax=Trachipleistophora hominis TaxID=72359 RepID=L7K0M6_TRAHO|nr:putative LRR containing protein [Trachipleistophora hominis]
MKTKFSSRNLKILTIDANVFLFLDTTDLACSDIKVLKIRFVWLVEGKNKMRIKKIELQELFIECEDNCIDPEWTLIKKIELVTFIDLLAKRINFSTLKYFAFISNKELVAVDPNTLMIVSRHQGTKTHHPSQTITYKDNPNFE